MYRAYSMNGAKRKSYVRVLLVGKSEGNGPLGIPSYRRSDNIKADLGEIE
jgi:hypothetical protein